VAQHLQTDHTECYVTPEQAREVIPQLPAMFDEPFADSSQIPTFLVSRLARQHVTVSLSGDGGDELFGGYNRYFHFSQMWHKVQRLPRPQVAAKVGSRTPLGPKLGWRSEFLSIGDPQTLYARFNAHWKDPQAVVIGCDNGFSNDHQDLAHDDGFFKHMMYVDALTYLPDDILTKVDRASMAVSLEARVPIIDHRVVQFAWTLPISMNVQGGRGKLLLRRVLDRYVPRQLVERPKVGFGVPIDKWLRGPLRAWAEELLDEERLKREGYFHPKPIREKWRQHLSGRQDWHYYLWDVLMFQAWLAAQPR
jgi:asparagine synthase (glutamine-hydrolysing)